MSQADQPLVVRPILATERARFDETLEANHWLGARLVGETMRYVAVEDGEWAALVGFGSAALCVRSREEPFRWSDSQRYRRLRYLTNNQRFCILDAHRRPNLASQVLSLTLKQLSADFEARSGHPVVAVETFTDPARHLGACYKAANFALVGYTSGYGRRAGRFVRHGDQKAYWLRALRRDATRLLSLPFDHPVIAERKLMRAADINRLDLSGLLDAFGKVPDPRARRGVRHRVAQILSIATLATLRGATSLVAIGEVASSLPEEALSRLDCFYSPSLSRRVAPEESTIRRVLRLLDADEVDRIVCAWTRDQVVSGRLSPNEAPEVSFTTMIEEDDDDGSEELLPVVAIDHKTLRGARLEENRQVHLLSAHELRSGATVA